MRAVIQRVTKAAVSVEERTVGAIDHGLVVLLGIREGDSESAAEWLAHMKYPWDEYGCATHNLRRGLNPPLSGSFDNWFHRSMGATIRAEIWGMIAPGAPDVAAAYAYQDAVLDHAGDGVWALVFLAALESAAFVVGDMDHLIDIGLARIPRDSRITRAVLTVRSARQAGETPIAARARVLREVGDENVTDAAQNLGFIALGLLYGAGDLGASLCAAVNCGYDTDTTGATVGAILGIMHGAKALPARWLEPIGDAVVVGWGVTGLPAPLTVGELAARTVALGERVVADRCPWVTLAEAPPTPVVESEGPAPAASEPPVEGAAEPPAAPDAT